MTAFNDGSSTGAGDRTGDYNAVVQAVRRSNSTDPPGPSGWRVGSRVARMRPARRSADRGPKDLGISTFVGLAFTMRLIWDAPNNRFLAGVNANANVALPYSGERRPAGGSALGGNRNPKQHGQLHRGRHGGRPRSRGRTGPDDLRDVPRRAADTADTADTAARHRRRRRSDSADDPRPRRRPRRHQGTTRRSRSRRNRHTTRWMRALVTRPWGPTRRRWELLCSAGRVRESAARFSPVCRQDTGRPSSVGAERRTARRDPARAPDREALTFQKDRRPARSALSAEPDRARRGGLLVRGDGKSVRARHDLDGADRLPPDRIHRHSHRRVPAVRVARPPTQARGRRGADRPHGRPLRAPPRRFVATRARQGYWKTPVTPGPVFQSPTSELNVFTPAVIIDLLDPVSRETGLTDVLARARGYLRRQIEPTGLVRYHGDPGTIDPAQRGCELPPDADDTALRVAHRPQAGQAAHVRRPARDRAVPHR